LLEDQLPGPLDVLRVAVLNSFPGGDALDQFQQFLPLLGMVGAGVVNQRGKGRGAGGGQGSPCPPDVQRTGVAVAVVVLPRRGFGDLGQGQVVFDEAFLHGGFSPLSVRLFSFKLSIVN